MPDIAMCKGGMCPKQQDCFRHTATPSQYRQAYFTEVPFEIKNGVFKCEYFWRNDRAEEKRRNL